ncbi:hypothetical protein TSAR_001400 [Trichomalopsis sarcophagae]|uniref:Ciliary microtubule inner protein 2A-C-like domain-containing protein n=1 Tax=Trichomalopsis sarcophagae TaxID=543379 RepID=A0A232FDL3_9HYME|nr:hypothetical protein TSAR_001400 [Trichomalopsis sarcophagae]
MVGVEILKKSEPHYVPGYTGYCPQHQFMCGENYGNLTHKLLLDPTINHAEKLVLVDNAKDYEVVKPTKEDIDIVNSRSDRTDAVYAHPMVPSYDGFVPNMGDVRDKPFEIQAIQGVAAFERQRVKRKASMDRLKTIIDLQSGKKHPETLEERLLLRSKFKLPLIDVRPEYAALQRTIPVDEKFEKPKDYNTSPYFMDNLNSQKYFINGYTGYRPYRNTHFGKTHKNMTADGLRDFTSNYLYKKRTEWAPVRVKTETKENSYIPVKNHEIYKKDTALMPTYTGHVPGAKYKIGKTFGYSSKNAHHYIEEELFSRKLKCKKSEQPVK